ncbi:MAG: hypothetical protein OEZ43_01230 [Gammaproteobacteria bacterium]|nr:hypothetical protein [Gammaproteobacteria bacterium]
MWGWTLAGSLHETDHIKEDMMSKANESPVVDDWELSLENEHAMAIYPDALSNEELRMLLEMREAIKTAQTGVLVQKEEQVY